MRGWQYKNCYPLSHVSEQNVTLVLSNKITGYIHEAYDIYVYMYSRKSMITVTNEVFKGFFINTKILSRSLQWFIIQYYFLFITISIFLLDKIQYHVSRFEHQIILGILANLLVLQSRPIYLQIFYLQKSPMLENSVCHCWWLWNINA